MTGTGNGVLAGTGAVTGAARGIVLHPVVRRSDDSSDEDAGSRGMNSDALYHLRWGDRHFLTFFTILLL